MGEAFVEPMRCNESMRSLNFGWNALNDADALALVQVLKQSRSLTEVRQFVKYITVMFIVVCM